MKAARPTDRLSAMGSQLADRLQERHLALVDFLGERALRRPLLPNRLGDLAEVALLLLAPRNQCVQGLADAFSLLRYPFESEEARMLNKEIHETIYYAALTASKDLSKINGPYSTYEGSPVSKGQFWPDAFDEMS